MVAKAQQTSERFDRPTRKGAQTRQRILDAAAVLLGDRGPDGLAMADIAECAGMSKASAYYYFTDCEQIVYEVVVGELDKMLTAFERAAATAMTAREALACIAHSFVVMLSQDRPLVRFVLGQLQAPPAVGHGDERERLSERLYHLVSTQLERGKAEGSVRADVDVHFGASAILGTFLSSAALSSRLPGGDGEDERLERSLLSFISHGVGGVLAESTIM